VVWGALRDRSIIRAFPRTWGPTPAAKPPYDVAFLERACLDVSICGENPGGVGGIDCKREHPGGEAGGDTGGCIFDDKALRRRNAETPGGQPTDHQIKFTATHHIAAHDHIEVLAEAKSAQAESHPSGQLGHRQCGPWFGC
jgi:hypothetical protein